MASLTVLSLQKFPTVSTPPQLKDWSGVSVSSTPISGSILRSLNQMVEQLQEETRKLMEVCRFQSKRTLVTVEKSFTVAGWAFSEGVCVICCLSCQSFTQNHLQVKKVRAVRVEPCLWHYAWILCNISHILLFRVAMCCEQPKLLPRYCFYQHLYNWQSCGHFCIGWLRLAVAAILN